MLALLFLLFCLGWLAVVAWRLHQHLPRRTASLSLAALSLWLIYVSALAYNGVLRSEAFPPRVLLLLLPLLAFILWLSLSSRPLALVRRVSLHELTGLQSFRILVEVFLLELWRAGQLPRGMTYHGHNFDILTGISALALFLLWKRIPRPGTVMRAWNILGLLLVAQVAVTGVLSAPGPQQILNHDQPNVAVVTFPFALIAALFVLSAVSLHILSLRKLSQLEKGARNPDPGH